MMERSCCDARTSDGDGARMVRNVTLVEEAAATDAAEIIVVGVI